ALVVESIRNELDHMLGHPRIDFLRETDEARIETVLPRLPREIVRIERNAVTANPWTGIKRHEAERLGRRRANHFPCVDVERVTESRHLVCHADVYRSKRVFEELRRFGDARRADRVYVIHDLRI